MASSADEYEKAIVARGKVPQALTPEEVKGWLRQWEMEEFESNHVRYVFEDEVQLMLCCPMLYNLESEIRHCINRSGIINIDGLDHIFSLGWKMLETEQQVAFAEKVVADMFPADGPPPLSESEQRQFDAAEAGYHYSGGGQ